MSTRVSSPRKVLLTVNYQLIAKPWPAGHWPRSSRGGQDCYPMVIPSMLQVQWPSQLLGRPLYLLHPVEPRFAMPWGGEQQPHMCRWRCGATLGDQEWTPKVSRSSEQKKKNVCREGQWAKAAILDHPILVSSFWPGGHSCRTQGTSQGLVCKLRLQAKTDIFNIAHSRMSL